MWTTRAVSPEESSTIVPVGKRPRAPTREANGGAIGGLGRVFFEARDGLVGREQGHARRGREQVVEDARDRDDPRLHARLAEAAVERAEAILAADPVGLVADDGAHDAGLVDAAERSEDDGGARGRLHLLLLAEVGHDAGGALADDAGDARARCRRAARPWRRARQHHVGGDLPGHRQAEDGGVDGAPGLVVVGVARGGDAEEGRRLAGGEVDEALGDALDALGSSYFPRRSSSKKRRMITTAEA